MVLCSLAALDFARHSWLRACTKAHCMTLYGGLFQSKLPLWQLLSPVCSGTEKAVQCAGGISDFFSLGVSDPAIKLVARMHTGDFALISVRAHKKLSEVLGEVTLWGVLTVSIWIFRKQSLVCQACRWLLLALIKTLPGATRPVYLLCNYSCTEIKTWVSAPLECCHSVGPSKGHDKSATVIILFHLHNSHHQQLHVPHTSQTWSF